MPLADRVSVSRRFQRAIRIDTDLGDPSALEGFVCPGSFGVLLENMARHISEKWSRCLYMDRTLWQWQIKLGRGTFRLAER